MLVRFSSLALLLAVAAACSSSDDSPPPQQLATSQADAGATADTGTGTEAGTVTEAGAETGTACNTLKLAAAPVAVEALAESAPAPLGGALVDGTYVTTRAVLYAGPGGDITSPNSPVAVTLRITGSFSETYIDGVARSATLSTSGTTLTAKGICPSAKVEDVEYTATSDTLSIFVVRAKGTLVQTFTRQ